MVGFFFEKSDALVDQRKTGEALIRLIGSVGDESAGSEWVAFKADPKTWLFNAGYQYVGPDAGPNGETPANYTLIPVYDTADTMHVRIPWKGVLEGPYSIQDEQAYGSTPDSPNRFAVFLARYFMRKCR
jgi:hypothetical protein